MRNINNRHLFKAFLVGGILLIVSSRLVQLFSGSIELDSDEAILALMSKHIIEGRDFAIFFYGQTYGLSIIESLTGAVFFGLFGYSDVCLKAAMLLLWVIGWVFFVLAVKKHAGICVSCAAGLVLIFCPAWSVWSMMARGGYVTAFLLNNVCLWLFVCFYQAGKIGTSKYIFFGSLLGLLFLSQSIWFLSFLPFVALLLLQEKKLRSAVLLGLSFFATSGIIFSLATTGKTTAYLPVFSFRPDIFVSLRLLPERLWVFFTGQYYMNVPTASRGLSTTISACFWSGLFFLSVFVTVYNLIKRRGHRIAYASFLSMAVVLGLTALLESEIFYYRYLLPTAAAIIFFYFARVTDLNHLRYRWKVILLSVGFVIVVAGGISTVDAKNFYERRVLGDYTANAARRKLVENLLSDGIQHVYCLEPLLQWNIIWDSKERIIARWIEPVDRYPAYPKAVDRAFYSGEKVALVGTEVFLKDVQQIMFVSKEPQAKLKIVEGHYFRIDQPSLQLLKNLGFKLHNPGEMSKAKAGASVRL